MVSSRISAAFSAASWSSSIALKTACSASLLQGVWRPAYSAERSVGEEASGDTDVIPGWSLPVGVTQQGRRVVGHHQRNPAEPVNVIAQRAERLLGIEQRLRRRPAHRQNHLRLDELDLAIEERQASRDLIVLRQPILGWPALHDVTDEDLIARQLDGAQDLREQLTRSTDERASRLVFGAAGTFTHHDELRRREPFSGNGVGAAAAQLALLACRDEGRDVLKTCCPLDWVGGEEICRRWIETQARRG